jgi:DNA-binding HxlR family transcriptional regulator
MTFTCPIDVPMHVLGGKWKPVLLFHLLDGPRRNGELLRLVPGITQKMLTQQLRELEREGLVRRVVHQEVPPRVDYAIVPREYEQLRMLLHALCDWGRYWASDNGALIQRGA